MSKESSPITLVLLGSGVRFPAFIGALSAIEEKGLKIGHIVGASAGSIVGTLYAAGNTPMELKKMAMDIDTSGFRDLSLGSILRGKGMYSGKALERHVDRLLEGRRFKDPFRIQPFVVATDILNNTPFVFSRFNFPDMKVSTSIRFSVGIPLVFAYKRFRHEGTNHVFVDGNLLAGAVEDMFAGEGKVLVLRVISRRSLNERSSTKLTLTRYIKRLLLIMMHAVEKERVRGRVWHDTILISCGDISPTKFTIGADEKRYLIEQGYLQTREYLEYKWGV
ncbi:MAG: patatin-like phospholipase family protein [Deltaproteobacteria bacterium]|nr:patatin-like phospholipase family protein [Deltaproteobacteria bacterium]